MSIDITDPDVIQRFCADEENTFLVSFPRTGSHWLRMVLELATGRPSLTRVFYYPERTDYLTMHSHDDDLQLKRRNVIYLWRNPVDTVFSQMWYVSDDVASRSNVVRWTERYARHLEKWLLNERFTARKTVVSYERMRQDMPAVVRRISEHLEIEIALVHTVTKAHVRDANSWEPRIVPSDPAYAVVRSEFRRAMGDVVWDRFKRRGALIRRLVDATAD
jgi:hypothetical protein